MLDAPAEVVRDPGQETDQDMERGTEATIFGRVAPKLPEDSISARRVSRHGDDMRHV
jgi:hypothetical protein